MMLAQPATPSWAAGPQPQFQPRPQHHTAGLRFAKQFGPHHEGVFYRSDDAHSRSTALAQLGGTRCLVASTPRRTSSLASVRRRPPDTSCSLPTQQIRRPRRQPRAARRARPGARLVSAALARGPAFCRCPTESAVFFLYRPARPDRAGPRPKSRAVLGRRGQAARCRPGGGPGRCLLVYRGPCSQCGLSSNRMARITSDCG